VTISHSLGHQWKLLIPPHHAALRRELKRLSMSTKPYRGKDGRYHFLYCTEHLDTGNYYIGKHSTHDLDDGYQGSGDWIKAWREREPDRLRTTPFLFFDSEEAAYLGEKDYLTEEKLTDLRCQNVNPGGEGRTSEGMRRTLARLEIKLRHKAGIRARWAKSEEREKAAAATRKAFSNPDVRAKYVEGSARRWAKPEEREKTSTGQAQRFSDPEERASASARTKAYAAANPDAMARNSERKKALWADPAWREKTLAAVGAGKAKMIAGPGAKRVETPEGVFPSLTAAAEHFGISRKRGARRVKRGEWRYVLAG
jgi:hypothetical protein